MTTEMETMIPEAEGAVLDRGPQVESRLGCHKFRNHVLKLAGLSLALTCLFNCWHASQHS
jgi:hypothetical protein